MRLVISDTLLRFRVISSSCNPSIMFDIQEFILVTKSSSRLSIFKRWTSWLDVTALLIVSLSTKSWNRNRTIYEMACDLDGLHWTWHTLAKPSCCVVRNENGSSFHFWNCYRSFSRLPPFASQNPRIPHMCIGWLVNEGPFRDDIALTKFSSFTNHPMCMWGFRGSREKDL
jgi:hypothetical protein